MSILHLTSETRTALADDNLSVNAEYRYTNYGTQIYELTHVTTAEFADHSVRAGINLHFD